MKKVILITGVSSGFGKSISEHLAKKNHIVYGTIRKDSENPPPVNLLYCDVTDAETIRAAVNTVIENEGRIDVLINNAGMGISGPIEFTSLQDIRLQMDSNFLGMVNTIQAVLPFMRNQTRGMILNMSSIGGIMGLPFQGFYSASKFAVEGLSESLRMELKPFNIKIIVIRPGDFYTGFTANRKMSGIGENAYHIQFRKTLSVIESDEKGGMKPDYLSKKIGFIIEKKNPGSHYIIASAEQKLAVLLKRFLPDSWFFPMLESHYGIKK